MIDEDCLGMTRRILQRNGVQEKQELTEGNGMIQ
jgi:hypothetical protein